jgi:hypothetical protein
VDYEENVEDMKNREEHGEENEKRRIVKKKEENMEGKRIR